MRWVLYAFILIILPQALAQNVVSPFFLPHEDKLYFEELTFLDNHPIKKVNCITEDHNGYLWIGTDNELLRFNGHGFKAYYQVPGEKNSISDNCVKKLIVANDTLLIIGTENGLSILNLKNYNFKNFLFDDSKSTPLKSITSLYKSGNQLWIGAYTGLFCLDIKSLKLSKKYFDLPVTKFSSRPSYDWIISIADYPLDSHSLLLGSEAGLLLYDTKSNSIIRSYPNKEINASSNSLPFVYKIQSEGEVAYSTSWVSGLNRVNLLTGEWTNYGLIEGFHIEDFCKKDEDEYWIKLANVEGIRIFNKKSGKFYNKTLEVVSGDIKLNEENGLFFKQSNGLLWIANSKGLCRQLKNHRTFSRVNIPSKYMWAWPIIEIPSESKYYFSLTFGKNLLCRDEKLQKWEELKAPFNSGYPLEARNAVVSSEGKLIITTYNHGICIVDPATNKVSRFTLKTGEILETTEHSTFLTPFFDSKDQLWLGTKSDGVYKISKDFSRKTHYPLHKTGPDGKPGAMSISSFIEDKYGRIWMSSTKGAIIYDPIKSSFSYIIPKLIRQKGLNAEKVYSIAQDTLHRIWMTIPLAGLIRVELKDKNDFEIKIFQKQNGLNNLNVVRMTADNNGCLWIMNDGLFFFNPYDETYQFIDEWNGLLHSEGGDSRILVDSKGNVFFSDQVMENLLQEFQHPFESKITHLAIEQLLVNGWPYEGNLKTKDYIIFSNNENNLSFQFSDICFEEPEYVQYRYKIEGLETSWNIITSLSEAHYNHIPPGKYTFVVNTGYRGEWLKNEARIAFIIKQPFWKSIWFMIGMILLVASILWLITIVRYRAKLNAERIRSSIASDLHDEINSTLSSISIMSDILKENKKADFVTSGLCEISKNSKSLLNKMDDIIWLINPAKDNFEDFELRLKEFMILLFESRNIEYNFECSSRIEHMHLPVEIRKNLFLIMKEGINNLVKYSQCSKAEILIQYNSPVLTAIIRDNGIGFNPDVKSDRNGIRNMRKRASQVKAVLNIISSDKNGTEIFFRIKL